MFKKIFRRFLQSFSLNPDELEILSNFLIEVAKGILGVPLIAYFIQGFSPLVLAEMFMLDFILVSILFVIAIRIRRAAKKRAR